MEYELSDDPQIRAYISLKVGLLVDICIIDYQDRQDVTQSLYLCVIEAMRLFDPNKSKRITYVAKVVDNRTNSMIRHYNALKRAGRTISLSTLLEVDGDTCELSQQITGKDHQRRLGSRKRMEQELAALRRDIQLCIDLLPEPLKRLAILLQTHSLSEAARMMGITRDMAEIRKAQIRSYLKRYGIADYLDDSSAS